MLLVLFVLLWLCQMNYSVPKVPMKQGYFMTLVIKNTFVEGKTENAFSKRRWYGPSYQPSNWMSSSVMELLRSNDFSYNGANGPSTWAEVFPECACRQQSPINIQTKDLKKRKTKKPLKWTNYSKIPKRMIIQNSLHSIHANGIWKNSSYIPYISNGPLEKRYYFSQLHFHWGKNDTTGSEHTVNKKSFPLEMHIVHDRVVEDPTNLSQENDSDHLVVTAFMFEIVKSDNPGLTPILDGINEVKGSQNKKAYVKPFPLENLIETFHGDYVSYKGSLTTPPCTEGVIWIINSKPLGISDHQMAVLRNSIKNDNGDTIYNYRPVQKLNGRNVYYIYC